MSPLHASADGTAEAPAAPDSGSEASTHSPSTRAEATIAPPELPPALIRVRLVEDRISVWSLAAMPTAPRTIRTLDLPINVVDYYNAALTMFRTAEEELARAIEWSRRGDFEALPSARDVGTL